MRLPIISTFAVLALLASSACSPTLNWREIRFDNTALVAMMPCKPERHVRVLPFVGGVTRELTMLSCEAGDASFAITMADLGNGSAAPGALTQWNTATQAHVRVRQIAEQPMAPPGATPNTQAKVIVGTGQLPNGQPMRAHMAYFSKGNQVFQAVLYAPQSLSSEAAEVFLTGLRFQ